MERENLSFKEKWFAKIENDDQARQLLKESKWGGWIFFGMYLLGLLMPLLAVPDLKSEEMMAARIGIAIVALLIAFMSWRIQIGKGWLSAILLVVLFVFEILSKVSNGTTNVGWFIFYLIVIAALVNSFRACWFLRKSKKENSDFV